MLPQRRQPAIRVGWTGFLLPVRFATRARMAATFRPEAQGGAALRSRGLLDYGEFIAQAIAIKADSNDRLKGSLSPRRIVRDG